jgi:2-polyprenyl-6-methoxyphenol hydroxylase-like FAD-dependent oxidoreductase
MCLVVGGGPAGLVLGLLLARAGVEVTVLAATPRELARVGTRRLLPTTAVQTLQGIALD